MPLKVDGKRCRDLGLSFVFPTLMDRLPSPLPKIGGRGGEEGIANGGCKSELIHICHGRAFIENAQT